MASRAFDIYDLSIVKRLVSLYAFIAVPSGTTPVLQSYVFPKLGVGGRVLATATVGVTPLGFPQNYQSGSEGFFSVARTATGLWTLTMQDNYQRLLSVRGDMSIAGGTANIIAVVENPTITNMSSVNGSVVGIALLSATATLADPTAAATTVVRIALQFGDATEP